MVDIAILDHLSVIALLMIVLIGLPHGALDGAIAMHLGAGRNISFVLQFLFLYLLCGFIVVVLWYNFPPISLAIFLIISMIHFGWGDANSKIKLVSLLQIICHGGVVVFGIVYFHIDEVIPLFDMLTQRNSNFPIQFSIYIFYAVSILTILYVYLIYSMRDLRLRLLELAVVWAIVIFLPPLFGFAVYFCFIHTTRHIRNIWMEIKTEMSLKALITQASILTIASWGMGITAFYIFDSGDLDTNIIRIIFIGLAALTVPHMILVDGFFRNK